MSPRSKRALTASIILAAVFLLLGALTLEPDEPRRPAPEATIPSITVTSPDPLDRMEGYAEIAERPLFAPTRRPAPLPPPKEIVAAAPEPPPPPPVLAPVTLLAVVISAARHEAVLRLSTGKSSTLAEGDSLDGWTLAAVLPDRVVFRFADNQKEIAFPTAQSERSTGSRPTLPPLTARAGGRP